MSDISPVLTKTAAAGAAQQPQALSGGNAGVFAAGLGSAGNFWDMILSNIMPNAPADAHRVFPAGTQEAAQKAAQASGAIEAASAKPAISLENTLAALQVALAVQPVDEDGNIILQAPEKNVPELQKQLDKTDSLISHLKNILPENAEKSGFFAGFLGKLQAKSDDLRANIAALETPVLAKDTPVEDVPMPLMIALGLSPAEITQIAANIEALEEKLGRDITVEDLLSGVGGLLPPAPEAMVVAARDGTAVKAQDILGAIDDGTEPTDDLAARLNALDIGGDETGTGTQEDADFENQRPLLQKTGADAKDASAKEASAKEARLNTGSEASFKENIASIKHDIAAKSAAGNEAFMNVFMDSTGDDAMLRQFGLASASTLNFGGAAQAANLVSSPTVAAGQTHPATQMVMATLTKAGKSGSDNIMTLRLDPPELGSVNIRLEFGKDKTVKALISAEKPETYMMLQRDSHALERALQSAGLETGGDSLTFELSDGGAFNHDNDGDRGGEKNFGGNAANTQGGDDEIIQSSVMWQVDPSTGHVRYNIYA
ncbi:MAG: flagellar hook-length control protein FliK [Micavibrio sp.]